LMMRPHLRTLPTTIMFLQARRRKRRGCTKSFLF